MTLFRGKQGEIPFELTMEAIDEMYETVEVPFSVGDVKSEAGQNMGSAKILSFGKISGLERNTVLQLFGDYFRKDVLGNPEGDDHPNIRALMAAPAGAGRAGARRTWAALPRRVPRGDTAQGGMEAVEFPEGYALVPKKMQDAYDSFGGGTYDL